MSKEENKVEGLCVDKDQIQWENPKPYVSQGVLEESHLLEGGGEEEREKEKFTSPVEEEKGLNLPHLETRELLEQRPFLHYWPTQAFYRL